MRVYNSVDPLADIKYWWRYEAYPIEKIGIYTLGLLALYLAFKVVTLDPANYEIDPVPIAEIRAEYEPMTPAEIALLTPEVMPDPIPINPRYADYVAHSNERTNLIVKKKKRSKKVVHKPKKQTKSERKISSAKHSAER
jgi:hypothetical protein